MDLNGDGDIQDDVALLFDVDRGDSTSLGLALLPGFLPPHILIQNEEIMISVDEKGQNRDLNGDGDLNDEVLHHVALLASPEGYSQAGVGLVGSGGFAPHLSGLGQLQSGGTAG